MICRSTLLVLPVAALLIACGPGKSTLEKRIEMVRHEAEEITSTKGNARGSDLTGTYILKLGKTGKMDCRGSAKHAPTVATADTLDEEVPCVQDGGRFQCTWIDGSVYKGYVNTDGRFGLSGSFMFEIEEGEKTESPTAAVGTFTSDKHAKGELTVAARGVQGKAKCLLWNPFELIPKDSVTAKDDEKDAELTVSYATADGWGTRVFNDLRTRGNEVGAKRQEERVVARFDDGETHVSALLKGMSGTPVVQGEIQGCSHTQSGDTITFECPGLRGTLVTR